MVSTRLSIVAALFAALVAASPVVAAGDILDSHGLSAESGTTSAPAAPVKTTAVESDLPIPAQPRVVKRTGFSQSAAEAPAPAVKSVRKSTKHKTIAKAKRLKVKKMKQKGHAAKKKASRKARRA